MIQVKRIAVVTLCMASIGIGFQAVMVQAIANRAHPNPDYPIHTYPEVSSLHACRYYAMH